MEYIFKGENILEFIKQLVMYQTMKITSKIKYLKAKKYSAVNDKPL